MPSTQNMQYAAKGTDSEAKNVSVSGFLYESVVNGITAFAGGGQASATLLTALLNRVTVVGTAADSVKLPASEVGLTIAVKNAAVLSLNVFPATGEIVNTGQAANAALAIASGKSVWFTCHVLGTWDATISA